MIEEEVLMHFMPQQWLADVMVPSMQQRAADASDPGGGEIRFSHILELLGVYSYFSVYNDMETFRDLWTVTTDGVFRRFRHPMAEFGVSRRRVERTKRWFGCLSPEELDAAHPAKGLLKMTNAFNEHWAQCFIPGYLCCQDSSVVKSTSRRDYLRVRLGDAAQFGAVCPGVETDTGAHVALYYCCMWSGRPTCPNILTVLGLTCTVPQPVHGLA